MMQIIKIEIFLIKRYACLILSVIMSLNINGASASVAINNSYEVGSGDVIYQYEKLLGDYKISSTSYYRNTLIYEIELYNSDLATEKYSSIEYQYSEAVEKKAELQELKDLYIELKTTIEDEDLLAEIDSQLAAIEAQINQYNSNIGTIQTSMAEAKLQEEIMKFYKNNHNLIEQEAQNKLIYEFTKKCYSLMLLKEQQGYYEAYHEYLKTVEKVENIKYQMGLTNLSILDLAKLDVHKNSISIEKNGTSYNSIYTYVKSEVNLRDNVKIILPISISNKQYNLEQTINQYLNNNANLAQLKHIKQCYQNYLYSNYGSYTLYKQIELRIKDYQLQYDQLILSIEAYVTEALFSYEKALYNLDLSEKEVQLAIKNYNTAVLKKENKMSTELEVMKAKYEREAAEVTYYQDVFDVIIWQCILDNSIYEVTP
jgi:hypothetical protein